MKRIFFTTLMAILSCCMGTSTTIQDYELFANSPVAEIARIIERNDIDKLKLSVSEFEDNLDFQEPKFGATLLMLTVVNQQFEACEELLKAGADPDIHSTSDGKSPIIYASSIRNNLAARFIKLLLSYGADPSDVEVGSRNVSNTTRKTPLIEACRSTSGSPLEIVKILVEAGAEINFVNEYNQSALSTAVLFDHYDVILYLLGHGVKYDGVISTTGEKNWYLWDRMRLSLFPLNSENHLSKMKVAVFLKTKGINYDTVQIPPYAVEEAKKLYGPKWEDYLKNY